jgi:hypothetical protein
VLKTAPNHKAEMDTSDITTPHATKSLPVSSAGVGTSSSALPLGGASKAKLAMGKDKKPAMSKSKKKEKELVTPLAYAQILCNKLDVLAKKTDFLRGKRLFYTGGDMQYASQSTKKKMELVKLSPPACDDSHSFLCPYLITISQAPVQLPDANHADFPSFH